MLERSAPVRLLARASSRVGSGSLPQSFLRLERLSEVLGDLAPKQVRLITVARGALRARRSSLACPRSHGRLVARVKAVAKSVFHVRLDSQCRYEGGQHAVVAHQHRQLQKHWDRQPLGQQVP